jgi:hypothetical protein
VPLKIQPATVLFAVAVLLSLIVVLVELGSTAIVSRLIDVGDHELEGYGVPSLWLMDGAILYTMLLITVSRLVPDHIHARYQGLATLIFAIVIILAALPIIFEALAALILRVALLLAIPFGTLIYLVRWGDFPTGAMAATLSALMVLRTAFAVVLVVSNPRHLQNKGLVLLIASAFVATIVVAFIHGFVPGIVASIADCIAGIVVAIIAIIWMIILAIGGIISIVKAVTG